MTSICEYITGGVRCDRLSVSSIDNRNFCWEHALLRRLENSQRESRDLFSEILNRPDVTLPNDLKSRVKSHTGMLSYLLEYAPI